MSESFKKVGSVQKIPVTYVACCNSTGIKAENSDYRESAESDVIRYSPLRRRDSTEETSAGRTPVTVLQFSNNSLTDKNWLYKYWVLNILMTGTLSSNGNPSKLLGIPGQISNSKQS